MACSSRACAACRWHRLRSNTLIDLIRQRRRRTSFSAAPKPRGVGCREGNSRSAGSWHVPAVRDVVPQALQTNLQRQCRDSTNAMQLRPARASLPQAHGRISPPLQHGSTHLKDATQRRRSKAQHRHVQSRLAQRPPRHLGSRHADSTAVAGARYHPQDHAPTGRPCARVGVWVPIGIGGGMAAAHPSVRCGSRRIAPSGMGWRYSEALEAYRQRDTRQEWCRRAGACGNPAGVPDRGGLLQQAVETMLRLPRRATSTLLAAGQRSGSRRVLPWQRSRSFPPHFPPLQLEKARDFQTKRAALGAASSCIAIIRCPVWTFACVCHASP